MCTLAYLLTKFYIVRTGDKTGISSTSCVTTWVSLNSRDSDGICAPFAEDA